MSRMNQYLFIKMSLMVVLALAVSGCSLFGSSPDPNPNPGEVVERVFLFEDFADYEPLTTELEGWTVDRGQEDKGIVEIVEVPELESRRAVRIVANPQGGETRITIPIPSSELENIETLVIEHRFKAISGSGSNLYITNPKDHINWRVGVSDGSLGFRRHGESMKSIASYIQGEWNHVRIVANVTTDTADIYLNDELIESAVPIREPADAWTGKRFRIQHSSSSNPAEILYGDIKIWTME